MVALLRRIITKMKHGEPVIVVSGLPRSGTSMMMKMLEAGGLEMLIDGIREADEDNPNGYFELERVKELDKSEEKAWLGESKGKVVKVISFLLKDLPGDFAYKVIFMHRDVDEVIASQNKMLVRRNESTDTTPDDRMKALYEKHLRKVKYLLDHQLNFEALDVSYEDALEHPRRHAERVNRFLGGRFDTAKMASVVDQRLYRNRK